MTDAVLFETLWRDAEEEVERLKKVSGFTDDLIAEAFHEHRRERQTGLVPWSEVQPQSGCWQYAHNFAARLSALAQTRACEEASSPTGANALDRHGPSEPGCAGSRS